LAVAVSEWTAVSVLNDGVVVEEDLSRMDGAVRVGDAVLTRTAEPTSADPTTLYCGHSLDEVLSSDTDLLGAALLAGGDPDPAAVAAALAPVVRMAVHTWVGTAVVPDKVGFEYGGRTANFDPAALVPAVAAVRDARAVHCGLVGGVLPVVRFVYPHGPEEWTELIAFAPERLDNQNPRVQPVWYRVARVRAGRAEVSHVDSSLAGTGADDPVRFWRDLLALKAASERRLAGGPRLRLPEPQLAEQARHSLLRAAATRVDGFPKYGVLDRMYGGSEHDGFPDTMTTEVAAATAWGLFGQARQALDTYLRFFVRPNATLVYRGPETGQYGRMLTVAADYARVSGDADLLDRHRGKLDAIADLLTRLHEDALRRPADDPGYGVIAGWCEADSSIEADPERYRLPYLSNSAEAARGLYELGTLWTQLGNAERGSALLATAASLTATLHTAIGRSVLATTPPCLPVVAGAALPYDQAARRDSHDPQSRAYRANGELLHSGLLDADQARLVIDYRTARRDVIAGVPTMYGWNSGELGGFLAYGHAHGLLQHDRIPEFLLALRSLAAHHYTRGSWTAPESRRVDPDDMSAPYCVPAQLTVPLLLRWALAFEMPLRDELWLLRGVPRAWFADGAEIEALDLPTRWGRVGVRVHSRLSTRTLEVRTAVPAPTAPARAWLRLRLPDGHRLASAHAGDRALEIDPAAEAIAVPPGRHDLIVRSW
jgi:hypothetical protein